MEETLVCDHLSENSIHNNPPLKKKTSLLESDTSVSTIGTDWSSLQYTPEEIDRRYLTAFESNFDSIFTTFTA